MGNKPDAIEAGKWAIFAIVILILWKIGQKFNLFDLGKSKEQTASEEATSLNIDIDFKDWTSPSFWQKKPPTGYQVAVLKQSTTDKMIEDLYNSTASWASTILSLGINTDQPTWVLGVMKKLKYKTQYSWLAYNYQKQHGLDLTGYLKDFFSEKELYPIWGYLETLPVYAKK